MWTPEEKKSGIGEPRGPKNDWPRQIQDQIVVYEEGLAKLRTKWAPEPRREKHPQNQVIDLEKGDQKWGRSCYIAELKADGIRGQVLPIEDMDVREEEESWGKAVEELIPIPLDPKVPKKVTYIGASL